jgi:hypothetical protein
VPDNDDALPDLTELLGYNPAERKGTYNPPEPVDRNSTSEVADDHLPELTQFGSNLQPDALLDGYSADYDEYDEYDSDDESDEYDEEKDDNFVWEDDEENSEEQAIDFNIFEQIENESEEQSNQDEPEYDEHEPELPEGEGPLPPNEPDNSPKLEQPGFIAKLKTRLTEIKEQAAAELHGDSKPASTGSEIVPVSNLDEEELTEPDESIEDPDSNEKKKSSKGSSIVSKVIAPFSNFYKKITDFFFNTIIAILGFLSKIPILGRPFSALKSAVKIVKIISQSIPLLLLVGLLVYINVKAVPQSESKALPDFGQASIVDFSFDKESNTASAIIVNEGETIAEITPVFELYGRKPGLNVFRWIRPVKISECQGTPVKVDIDKKLEVKAVCKGEVPLFLNVTGRLE